MVIQADKELAGVRETARILNVSHPTIIRAIKGGHIEIREVDGRRMVVVESAKRFKAETYNTRPLVQKWEVERIQEENPELPDKPDVGSVISQSAAARKYGVAQPLISRWASKEDVKVVLRPTEPGGPVLLDEVSVWERMLHFKPKKRKYGQRGMKLGKTGVHPTPAHRGNGRPPHARSQGERPSTPRSVATIRCPHCGNGVELRAKRIPR